VSYGSDALIAVMNFNIVLSPSLLQLVFHKQRLRFIALISLINKKQQKSM